MALSTLLLLTLSVTAAPPAGEAPAPRATKGTFASKPLPLPEANTKEQAPPLTLPSAKPTAAPTSGKPRPKPTEVSTPTTISNNPPATTSSGNPSARPSARPAPSNTAPLPRTDGKLLPIAPCLVSLIQDVQVPALEAGAIVHLGVEDGAVIKQGQLLAQLDDRQPKSQKMKAELERDAALAKASDDIEVRYSMAALEFSNAELTRLLTLDKKGSGAVSSSDIEKARLARHRDELQIDRSKLDLKVAKMTADVHQSEVDAAEENVQRRKIISPIDGEVVQILHERGEWVNAGEPILQLVRMDFLRIEGFVSISEAEVGQLANKPVQVEVALAGGRRELFEGEVVFVSPVVHAGGKYRVRAEVANRTLDGQWLLRPGMNAVMNVLVK